MVNRPLQNWMACALVAISAIGCSSTSSSAPASYPGTLDFRANGEDFVRQGFVAKDGWAIAFNHLYVTLAEVTAYQSNPPFNPDVEGEIEAEQTIRFHPPKTVDLAAGDETAEPILVYQATDAPAGAYNALSWKMIRASEGLATGNTLVLDGVAQNGDRTINFTISINREYQYYCGEFVGDGRKGLLAPGKTSDLEATFHFDHIFGDADAPPDDPINTGALGFEPLAKLATDGTLEVDDEDLRTRLSPEEEQRLTKTLLSLGHVGEGHCRQSAIAPN